MTTIPTPIATVNRSGVRSASLWTASLAVFLGAWLVFQIQPLMSKVILPWYGGTPQVWTMCLLFFQTLLFAGYAFAFFLARVARLRAQVILFVGLLGAGILLAPIIPSAVWKPDPAASPAVSILQLLSVHIGLPYLLLAATGPLLQDWFRQADEKASPYPLYALSNAGSLLALITYPFLIDWFLPISQQAQLWWWTYIVFALVVAVFGWKAAQHAASRPVAGAAAPVGMFDRVLWFFLAMAPTVLLAAFTNQLSLDIGSIPFLWVLPLTLYLLSLILCFARRQYYYRGIWITGFLGMVALTALVTLGAFEFQVWNSMAGLVTRMMVLFFCACMVCHGELVRIKPPPARLTEFYLVFAAGGAAGGIFVGLVSPLIFQTYLELPLGIVACYTLGAICWFRDPRSWLYRHRDNHKAWFVAAAGFVALIADYSHNFQRMVGLSQQISRNFYGVLRIVEREKRTSPHHNFSLAHGTTMHGSQFTHEPLCFAPTTYYGPSSGIGLVMAKHAPDRPRRIGVIGLGTGTIATYGQKGDVIDFYEINPAVIGYAKNFFRYLGDSEAEVNVLPGDARLTLEGRPPQQYDVLVIDAFSSDAIPLHLLTREAMEIYLRHLRPDGILAFHVTCRYYELVRVLAAHARALNLTLGPMFDWGDQQQGTDPSDWVLMSRDRELMKKEGIPFQPVVPISPLVEWTDARNSLIPVLKDNPFKM